MLHTERSLNALPFLTYMNHHNDFGLTRHDWMGGGGGGTESDMLVCYIITKVHTEISLLFMFILVKMWMKWNHIFKFIIPSESHWGTCPGSTWVILNEYDKQLFLVDHFKFKVKMKGCKLVFLLLLLLTNISLNLLMSKVCDFLLVWKGYRLWFT